MTPPAPAEAQLVPPPATHVPLWRRVFPFAFAASLVAYLGTKIDVALFVQQLARTNYLGLFALAVGTTLALMATDSLATVGLYRRVIGPVSFRQFFVLRAASYLPSLLNHHLGQAWITYFISRLYQAPLWRVAGVTLLAYATILGCLLAFAAASLPFNAGAMPWLLPAVGACTGLGAAYLLVIAARPRVLKRWQATAVLLEVGVGGHLAAFAYRVPHMIVLFLGTWLPFFFFGVRIPLGYALAAIPPMMLLAAFPFTPQGVGARDLLAVQLFASFASGTLEERRSVLVAATLSWACTLVIVQLVISPLFMRRARILLQG